MIRFKDENKNIIEQREAAMLLAEDIMSLLDSNFTFYEVRPLAEKRAAELKHLLCADHFADAGKMVENSAACKQSLQVPAAKQPMSAGEYERILQRMEKTQPMPEELYLHGKAVNHHEIDKAISIVEQWAAEHPEKKRKTYAEDFFEKFPNARRTDDRSGIPYVCRRPVYGPSNSLRCFQGGVSRAACKLCWNEKMGGK